MDIKAVGTQTASTRAVRSDGMAPLPSDPRSYPRAVLKSLLITRASWSGRLDSQDFFGVDGWIDHSLIMI
jgi:hypothetical protein